MARVLGIIVLLLAGCDALDAEGCLTNRLHGYEGYVPSVKLQAGISHHTEARILAMEAFARGGPSPIFEACAVKIDSSLFSTSTEDEMAAAWLECVQENC